MEDGRVGLVSASKLEEIPEEDMLDPSSEEEEAAPAAVAPVEAAAAATATMEQEAAEEEGVEAEGALAADGDDEGVAED